MGTSDNEKGLILAVASSLFIGTSFILKKKGLKRAAASSGTRAGVGGYTYLLEPLWWAGMITMVVGEIANFVAYVYAPAVLVTPLGALSIIVSAILAHFMLKERLQKLGVIGCMSCVVGSVVIVIHAPEEQTPSSVLEIWTLATQPAFLIYVAAALSIVLALILHFEPRYGQTNILVYLGICSLMGSLTVILFPWLESTLYYSDFMYHCLMKLFASCQAFEPVKPFSCHHAGFKHKGNWNCNKAYPAGDKSNCISSDLVLPISCSYLCGHAVELSEQERLGSDGSHVRLVEKHNQLSDHISKHNYSDCRTWGISL